MKTTKTLKERHSNQNSQLPKAPKEAPPERTPRRSRRRCETETPVLRFTPYAWAKLHFFCHHGDTEIGGFGLSHPDDPLLVTDFLTLKQQATCVSVEFDDEAVAELFEDQVDEGHRPEQFARLWCHTHPGDSSQPSATDEETFERVFRGCDWAVMLILARGGQTYARLRFTAGPGGTMNLPVTVDYAEGFPGADHDAWEVVYDAHIQTGEIQGKPLFGTLAHDDLDHGFGAWADDDDPFNALDLVAAYDPQDLDQDREQIELLMDEYCCSDMAELRALMLHEDRSVLDATG